MKSKDFASKLGLPKGSYSKGNYIIDLQTDKEYFKYLSVFDKSTYMQENSTNSVVNDEHSVQLYDSEQFDISLVADFVNDIYRIVIAER